MNDASCFSGHGFAWVTPKGVVHRINESHARWARNYMFDHPELMSKTQGFPDMGMSVLLNEGWVRVANATHMSVAGVRRVSRAAWAAIIDLLIECVTAGSITPETMVYVDENDASGMKISVADFAARFGGRRAEDEIFGAAMARMASQVTMINNVLAKYRRGIVAARSKLNVTYGKFTGDREAKTSDVLIDGQRVALITVENDEGFQDGASRSRTLRFGRVEVYAIGRYAARDREAIFEAADGYTRASGVKAAKAKIEEWFANGV